MSAPVFQMSFIQDIKRPIMIQHCGNLVFTGDNLSDTVSVSVLEDGEPYAISGTVSMNCIRADGATVTVTGSVSGNTASATLTQACVAIPGPLAVVMKITSDTTTTTLLKAVYMVDVGVTGTTVDPGTIIPDINALISAIETAVGSIPSDYSSLLATIAPNFASGTYSAGAYVWYNGTLYRFTADHSGSWTGTDVETVVIGNELTNLKSAIAQLDPAVNGQTSQEIITSTDWLIRGIVSQTGAIYPVTPDDNRITTKWFIHAKAGSTIALDDYTNYGFGIAYYSSENVSDFVSYSGFAANKSTLTLSNDSYIILTMRYEDNRKITDIDALTSHMTLNIITEEHTNGCIDDVDGLHEILKNDVSLIHKCYKGKKQYRIHVDEVIWALWDLATNNYQSIFDQSEFADYKRIHDLYGTCFVLSLHYTQDSTIAWNAPIPPEMIGWSLEDMPDTWRTEFKANSDWLKFSFHTYSYSIRYAEGSTARPWEQDIVDMHDQVARFAGEECWICEFAKTHGVLGDQKYIRIFMDQGAKYFEGDSEHVEVNDPGMQSYYLTDEQQNKMFADGTYYDPTNKALFIAGAANLERLYGFVGGTIPMDYYLDNYVFNPSYTYRKKCDYMSFCSHESPMMNGLVIILNNVKSGDSITLNGATYTAGTDFNVGASDNATAANLYAALPNTISKYQLSANFMTIYATLGAKSDTFEIRTPMQQIELVAKWCNDNGWIGHHLDESSFYLWS